MNSKKSKKQRLPALYRAAIDYIEKHNGTVIVIGGVSLLHLPKDKNLAHHLVIDFMGEAPKFRGNTKP